MSLARSVTSFCIDISPSMGSRRVVEEEVLEQGDGQPQQRTGIHDTPTSASDADGGLAQAVSMREAMDTSVNGNPSLVRRRETTDLEWVMEFVAKKVQNYILSGLKTARIHLLLFGSSRTHNVLLETSENVTEGYDGVDEIWLPEHAPEMSTLELVRCLRASNANEKPFPADPIDAIIAAITTLNTKPQSAGATSTWKRTIYLITDGKTPMNTDDHFMVERRLIDDNILLKVVGIDFDDEEIGFQETDKDPVKAENERFWQTFLADKPGCGVASAARVLAQSALPSVHMQNSAPYSTLLTFGDPESRNEDNGVLDIAVKMYKATAPTRPLTQKKLSKIAQDSDAAKKVTARIEASLSQMKPSSTPSYVPSQKRPWPGSGDDDGPTYGVETERRYFIRDDLEQVEGGINAAKPLPEGAEETFERAYKLGATLVAVNDDLQRIAATKAGLEIIQFTNKALYRRSYHMGETWFVFADDLNSKAQVLLSSMIRAMYKADKYAIVRFVRRDGTDAKLGILAPQIRDEGMGYKQECFFFVEAPFGQDIKRFTFPPLDRVINREGKDVYEHSSLPSKEMKDSMNSLVDAMDLTDADEGDDAMPWFQCQNSFNPAIHITKEAVLWRVFHPDDRSLPKPQAEVLKYLQPPRKIVKRSADIVEKCRTLLDLQYVPTSAGRKEAGRHAMHPQPSEMAAQGGREIDSEPKLSSTRGADVNGDTETAAARRANPSTGPEEPASTSDAPADQIADATADASEADEEWVDLGKDLHREEVPKRRPLSNKIKLKAEDPIKHFNVLLDRATIPVEDVVDAMCSLVLSTITSSFASNNYIEARDMLIALRSGAIDYEESVSYNAFLRDLKVSLLEENHGKRSRRDFWDKFVRGRTELGLITDDEALGEQTGVDANAADGFINM